MPLPIVNGLGDAATLKSTLDGSAHVPHNNVDTLPAAFTTDTGAIKTAVQALAAIISGGRLAVDLSSTVVTYLANLANIATYLNTLQGVVTAARLAVNVDSTTTGKLDTLHTDLAAIATAQGVPAGGPKFGYKGGITTTGPYTFATKTLTRGCAVTNLDATNNLLISVGGPGATDVDTYTVKPGATSPFIAVSNANGFNMLSSAGTITACYAGA